MNEYNWLVGALAQLIERIIRIDEVGGLNPPCSTNKYLKQPQQVVFYIKNHQLRWFFFFQMGNKKLFEICFL